ncbi:CopD family protein [Undibacterium arcticum]|uniref:CopD family protein n=1 Tax=Undibacterium arcticum TaxID=1762892 RepID=UPI003621B4EF
MRYRVQRPLRWSASQQLARITHIGGLGSLDNLSGNAYGRALTIKLWLVALAVGLGAFNRFIGFPAVVTPDSRAIPLPVAMHRLVFILRLESFVLLGVLIAAAALSGEAPPALS